MAERFYCPDASAGDGRTLRLVGDEARHLARVRRVGVGEVVELFDGRGHATHAEVLNVGKDQVELRSQGPPLPDRAPDFELTLAVAVPKGDRFDWLVEKATELGVARLVPLRAERSVVDPRESKLERLRRVVVEASKQCGRNRLMAIERATTWGELLDRTPDEAHRVVAHPGGLGFGDWPRPRRTVGGSAVLAIGPEGGLTDGEIAAARQMGWAVVGLGPTLLRVETAALAASVRLLALVEGINDGERE